MAVVVLSGGLAVLPVLIVLGLLTDPAGRLGAALAGLVAVLGGVKLAAAGWGAAASID